MKDKRIIHVKNIVEAGLLMNKQFAGDFPIPLRGAIASLGGTIDLSYPFEGHLIELKVKGIEQILNDGTEFDFDSEFGWTRVDYFPRRVNWAFAYAKNRGRIDNWVERADISDEKAKLLKPIILVYEKSLLTKPPINSSSNVFNVKLPQRFEDRSRSIISVYVNHTENTEDLAHIFF